MRVQNIGNQNGLIGVPGNANQNLNGNGNLVAARAEVNAVGHNGNQIMCYNCRGVGHFARNYKVRPKRRDVAYLQTQLLIGQKEEAGIQLQAKEFDLIAAAADLDEIEEVNANCILMANLQQAATSEEQYTELLEPIPESHKVPQNDNNVISKVTSVEQSGETVEQHPVNVEETRALYDSLYQNLAIEVEKVNTVNRKLKETNAELATELARFENQEKPNGKLIRNSIINGPYVRQMIPEPGNTNREVPVNETFHVQTDDELTEKELKQIEADDQAIQTILLGLPEDIYAAVDSCETAQETWLRVQQMMKGSDIGIQEKKTKLFNERERFTSNDGESIESYYHCFLKLMNDLK
uniref:CCHC-type domain-containing protein n=1 Tax=Tanacetum cinerariifolium TaxID=118510 RepID=A0A6L2KMB4_TANCI|nr:hypothetical protein [Tanacetum cinerariifolium]